MSRRLLTPEVVEKLVRLRLEGLTLAQLAERFGVSQQAVSRATAGARGEAKGTKAVGA